MARGRSSKQLTDLFKPIKTKQPKSERSYRHNFQVRLEPPYLLYKDEEMYKQQQILPLAFGLERRSVHLYNDDVNMMPGAMRVCRCVVLPSITTPIAALAILSRWIAPVLISEAEPIHDVISPPKDLLQGCRPVHVNTKAVPCG